MSKIQVLDKHTAELIAAGEVVERPSSVVKELMENAIDAGASSLTVEIKNGGVRLIRITDNGAGIAREDVATAFLRHATSKVRTQDDLDSIGTLGFRGEALASICAVAKVELLTCTAEEMVGTRYVIHGGEEQLTEDAARPQGTTIVVRDLFYNVPARMKFLKKDVSESNSVAGVVDRIALSHSEVSVRFIRDGKEELLTPGDGKLLSCIYTVFGKKFAAGMMPLDYTLGGVHIHGYIGKPSCGRANRTMQHFFINGRYVKTRTAMVALEQAYKGCIMVGKFPSCVIHIDLPLETVDVNVHPAKIEVRFVNERPLFDVVYHGVKSALQAGDIHSEMKFSEKAKPEISSPAFTSVSCDAENIPQQTRMPFDEMKTARTIAKKTAEQDLPPSSMQQSTKKVVSAVRSVQSCPSISQGASLPLRDGSVVSYNRPLIVPDILCDNEYIDSLAAKQPVSVLDTPKGTSFDNNKESQTVQQQVTAAPCENELISSEILAVRVLGEAFKTYIIAQMGCSIYFIDKHAAHERILYNELKATQHVDAQMLLSPVTVSLSREEYAALIPELETLQRAGYEVEDFGGHSVLVRAIPMLLDNGDAAAIIQEIAGDLAVGRRDITTDKLDWIFHSSACRAAIKAGDISRPQELQAMAERVLQNDDIRTCPHGRPVCFELTRRELEKQFGRVK